MADMARQSNTREAIDYTNPKPGPQPTTSGYPQTGAKSSGVVTRGNGAATKGKTARGPL